MFASLMRKLATLARSPGLPVVRSGGRVWYVTPAGAELFGPGGPQLERWLADGAATVVKANPARTVYRAELPGGAVFVKHCRVTGPRAWMREVLRPPKARLEFDNSVELRSRGVSAVEPLAWGTPDSRWPGESLVITRGVSAVPLQHYLEHTFPALPPAEQRAARRQLAFSLAAFFARLHDAGVAHPDPHPGNVLVEVPACRVPKFTLLDLHDVHAGPPLSWGASRDNLALFNCYFQMRAHRSDRARFWHAYRRARAALPMPSDEMTAAGARAVERVTHAANLRLWSGRERRWLGSSRGLRKVRCGGVRGLAVRDLPDEFVKQLLADPDAAFTAPGVRVLKDCRSSTVAVLPMPTAVGPVGVVFKRLNATLWTDPVKNVVRRSEVLRSWLNGHALRDRWLPTPRPLAVFHRYRCGLPAEGYLLTELVPGAVQLDTAARVGIPRATLLRLARVLRQMHDRGVSHRDLKAANVLLANGTDPSLIDLVGVRTGVRLAVARRAKELARLNASFTSIPAITRGDRLRFLRAYLAAGESSGVGWKSWWNLVSRETATKVAKNRRAGRVLG
jgi:tRNA A-37 threonylcarbamoyl transferase component Bud32